MSIPGDPDRRTPKQRAADERRHYEAHWLEDGKAYTFEVKKYCKSRGVFANKMRWICHVKQAFCPWMIVATEVGFLNRFTAAKWGRDYLNRGGPPPGFFDPPPPDPNEVVYRKKR